MMQYSQDSFSPLKLEVQGSVQSLNAAYRHTVDFLKPVNYTKSLTIAHVGGVHLLTAPVLTVYTA